VVIWFTLNFPSSGFCSSGTCGLIFKPYWHPLIFTSILSFITWTLYQVLSFIAHVSLYCDTAQIGIAKVLSLLAIL